MTKTRTTVQYYLKWLLWVLVVQLVLANISAAIYAWKFTHFKEGKAPPHTTDNLVSKTWKLFVGPTFYKSIAIDTPDFPVERVLLRVSTGTEISGWYSASDTGKACILLFHGYSTNKTYVLTEARQFKTWGYNVMLIDFRDHGTSGGKSSTFGYKESDEIGKAFAFARSKGNSKIILYGVSMGAVSVLKATAEGRLDPEGLIIDMPFASLQDHFKSRAASLGFPAQPFAFLISAWIGIEQGYNPFCFQTCSYAKRVNCPVLMQWGEKDIYVTNKETKAIFNCLNSKDKKLIIYPTANHESFLQNDPQQWEKEIGTFLSKVAK